MDTTYVSHHDRVKLIESLTAAAAKGALTVNEIDKVVRTYYDDRDYIDESIGTTWICQNPGLFQGSVPDALAFFRAHLETPHCTELLLLRSEILRLVPESERLAFIREAYLKNGARNYGWIDAALEAGVPREAVADLLLEKLRAATADRDQEYNYATAARDFIEYGNGDSYRNPPWSMLDDARFLEAVRICAEKTPRTVFSRLEKIRRRLDEATITALRLEAAKRPGAIGELPYEELRRLPYETQFAMVEQLRPDDASVKAVRLIVNVLMEGTVAAIEPLCARLDPILAKIDPVVCYRTTWKDRQESQNRHVAAWFEEKFKGHVRLAGYRIGTVTTGTYADRRSRSPRRQMQVVADGRTYVQSRYQHRYFPGTGDTVIFYPGRGHQLTPLVTAVMFIPAHNDSEY